MELEYNYNLNVDSFGTEYATIEIFNSEQGSVASFIAIPAENGYTEEYVKQHLEELAEQYKPVPYYPPEERLDVLEPLVKALAEKIIELSDSSDDIQEKLNNLIQFYEQD